MNKVLLTDGSYNNTLAAARSLHREGYIVDVIGSRFTLNRWSRMVRQVAFDLKHFNDQGIDDFVRFLEKSDYDALVPIGGHSVHFVARHRDKIEPHVKLTLATYDKIEKCMNKPLLNDIATKHGVHVPETAMMSRVDECEAIANQIGFPAVLKGSHETHVGSAFNVFHLEELKRAFLSFRKLNPSEEATALVQKRIVGRGFGFFAAYEHGQMLQHFMHKRIREVPPTGGGSSCAESVYNDDLFAAGKSLLDALAWHGVAMVEFKREEKTGKFYLMEINPKFWGSLDLAITAGVPFPNIAVALALNKKPSLPGEYKVGLRFQWPFGEGDFEHALRRPGATWSVLRDFCDPRVKNNMMFFDPLPTLRAFASDVKAAGARLLRW